MPEDKMFAELMNERPMRGVKQNAPEAGGNPDTTHDCESPGAPGSHRRPLLCPPLRADLRPTRGQIVATALEVLDRLLQGRTPERLDGSILDDYVNMHASMQAPVHAGTQACS
jgi:hypothetical protein